MTATALTTLDVSRTPVVPFGRLVSVETRVHEAESGRFAA